MQERLGELLYNFFRSPVFWVILGIWAFILIASTAKSKAMIFRISTLIMKPIIFKQDPQPQNISLYPRKFLEEMARTILEILTYFFSAVQRALSNWIQRRFLPIVYEKSHPYRAVASLLFLAFLALFQWALAIAGATVLPLIGAVPTPLPAPLLNYQIVALSGSLIACIVSMTIYLEILQRESILTDLSEKPAYLRGITRVLATLLLLDTIITVVVLGLIRKTGLIILSPTPFKEAIIQVVMFVVLPSNCFLGALLVFPYAIKGVMILLYIALWIIIAMIWTLGSVVRILGVIAFFVIDLMIRTLHIVLDICFWVVVTPVQFIFYFLLDIPSHFRGHR